MENEELRSFIEYINEHDLPIFAQTAIKLRDLMSDEKSSVGDLAHFILRDSALTARVIRLANSSYFNRNAGRIHTINRAIIQLGIQSIQSICISANLVEKLLSGKPRERVVREMVEAFQAAVHSKALATARREPNVEELFVATLLLRIGHLAFWGLGGKLADCLDTALENRQGSSAEIEKEVIGFRLDQLSSELVREWGLGALILKASLKEVGGNPRVYNMLLSHRLTQDSKLGWNDPRMQETLHKTARFIKSPLNEVRTLVKKSVEEAEELVLKSGLGKYVRFLPLSEAAVSQADREPLQDRGDLAPDPHLQLEILQDLSSLIRGGKADVHLLLSTLMEGICRGLGMGRVVLLICSADRKRISARYAIGVDMDIVARLDLPLQDFTVNALDHLLGEKKPVWVRVGEDTPVTGFCAALAKALDAASFFLMPLCVQDRVIGVLYADRYHTRRPLDENSFVGFQFFMQMTNTGLAGIASSLGK